MAIDGRRLHVRKDPKERKTELLNAGVKLAQKWGISNVSRTMVADATKTTDGLVSRYFGSTEGLHKAIKSEVKKQGVEVPDEATTEKYRLKLWNQRHPNAGKATPEPKAAPKKSATKKSAGAGAGAAKPAATATPKPAVKKPAAKKAAKAKKVGTAKKSPIAKATSAKPADAGKTETTDTPAKATGPTKKVAAKPVKKPTVPKATTKETTTSKTKKAPATTGAPELPPLPATPPANGPATPPGLPPLP